MYLLRGPRKLLLNAILKSVDPKMFLLLMYLLSLNPQKTCPAFRNKATPPEGRGCKSGAQGRISSSEGKLSSFSLCFGMRNALLCGWQCYESGSVLDKITSDPFVLAVITSGLKLDFVESPCLLNTPPKMIVSGREKALVTDKIQELLSKKVLVPTELKPDSYLSNIFTTANRDNSIRLILNLKTFNQQIRYVHFKTESLRDALQMITPGMWMASIDLWSAYYTIPVHPDDRKYFTFSWEGSYFEFTCMPNGYCQAPLVFTKILKQVFSHLRQQGYASVIYIDDTFLQGLSSQRCLDNVVVTGHLLRTLGFTINIKKSILTPAQQIRVFRFYC